MQGLRKYCPFVLAVLLISGSAFGQPHWSQIYALGTPYQVYFFNDSTGFLYQGYGSGKKVANPFYKTTDGAKTWVPVSKGPMDYISDLWFVSPTHGYAAAIAVDQHPTNLPDSGWSDMGGGIFETLDGGTTWNLISPPGYSFMSVRAIGNHVFGVPGIYTVTTQTGPVVENAGMWITPDAGNTFSWNINAWGDINFVPAWFRSSEGTGLTVNSDSMVVVPGLNGLSKTPGVLVSTDLGMTWMYKPAPIDLGFFPDFYMPTNESTIFIRQDSSNIRDYSLLYKSSDTGSTWPSTYRSLVSTSFYDSALTGEVSGRGCAIYMEFRIGNSGLNATGLLRSTDDGATWLNVGGPSAAYWTNNFAVVGNGAVVYAMDNSGNLWRTTNGGDGNLSSSVDNEITFSHSSNPLSSTNGQQDTLSISLCDSASLQMAFAFQGSCNHATMDSVYIDGLPQNFYSALVTHAGSGILEQDSAFVRITPMATGSYQLLVHSLYLDNEGFTGDTTFPLALNIIGAVVGATIKPTAYTSKAGGTISIPVYLTGSLDVQSAQSLGLQTLTLTLVMNTDLLMPETVTAEIAGIGTVPIQINKDTVTLVVQIPSNFSFADSTELLLLNCKSFVADTMQTSISMKSVTYAKSNAGCLLTLPSDTIMSTYALNPSCGDSTISRSLGKSPAFAVQSIVPNPTSGNITVSLESLSGNLPRYEIFDALGRTCAAGSLASSVSSLDLSGLNSGVYYLRLSGAGRVESRQIVIER